MKNTILKFLPFVLVGYACFVVGRLTAVHESTEPETVESITLAAQEARDSKDFGTAVELYTRALALRPGDAALRGSLGLALAEGGRAEDAIGELERCLVLDPDRFDIVKQLGKALYRVDRFKEAKRRFMSVVRNRPEDAEAYEWLFTINNRIDQQLDNLPVLEKLAELRPDDPQYPYAKIMVYHHSEMFDEALAAHQELPAKEQESPKGRYVLAAIYHQNEDYTTAIQILEQLVSEDPNHTDAKTLLNAARTQSEQARIFSERLAQVQKEIEADPNDPEPHFQLGFTFHNVGRTDDATAAFQESLKRLGPEDVTQAKRLAQILYGLERFDLAEQFLQQIADEAKDTEIYQMLLGISTQRNEPLKNIPILQKLAELNPDDTKFVTYQLGIYLENNKPQGVVQVLAQLPEEEQQQAKNQYFLGVARYQLKEYAEASRVLELVVSKDPENADAKKLLELCRAKLTP